MKRIIAVISIMIVLLSFIIPASAVEQDHIIYQASFELEDGITVLTEVIEHIQTRSSTKDYTNRHTFSKDGTVIAVISLYGEFKYDGITVSVVSKSVPQTDTYEGWSYKQNAFTSSGGTITLDAKLTKLLVLSIPFTMTLSCDKNGNLSYT